MQSPLQKKRQAYTPQLPPLLSCLEEAVFEEKKGKEALPEIQKIFPKIGKMPFYHLKKGKTKKKSLKIGVFFSGGPAAGGHNVIAGMFDMGASLIGFLGGAKGLLKNQFMEIENVDLFRNQGGFDLIGTGREKIETKEQLALSMDTCKRHALDGLVVIGGDDSNTNAAILAEYFLEHGCATKVIGVPKTIDGDLRSEDIEISFGFDSATKTYAELIGNLAQDALSTKKYYHFIKLMGRSASHVVLECALLTQPNLALIGEERKPLASMIDEMASLVINRFEIAKPYGVILVPEGLVEFVPELHEHFEESSIGKDPHGNLDLSKVETDQWIIELVQKELQTRGFEGKFEYKRHSFGYEGRSCLPSNFDANYAYSLGRLAVFALNANLTGVICSIQNLKESPEKWEMKMVPITRLMHLEDRLGKQKPVIKKKVVDLKQKTFLKFSSQKEKWKLSDCYLVPGPIQFCLNEEIANTFPKTLE